MMMEEEERDAAERKEDLLHLPQLPAADWHRKSCMQLPLITQQLRHEVQNLAARCYLVEFSAANSS
jgi:hypothetical protein